MFGLVIDEHGKIWPENKFSSRTTPNARDFDGALDEFLQRGVIYLKRYPTLLIVIFSPHLVARRTLTGAFFEIARQSPGRVDLLCCGADHSWRETLSPIGRVFERMDRIVGEAARSYPRGLLTVRLRPDVVSLVAGGRLTPVYRMWSETHGVWNADLYGKLEHQNLLDDTVIVRNPRRSSDLLIEHWGRKRDLFGAHWVSNARGKAMQDQPYPGIGTWTVGCMRETVATREPRLEAIHVQIRGSGGRTRQRRYERLMLPWMGPGGDAFTTTINVDHKRSWTA